MITIVFYLIWETGLWHPESWKYFSEGLSGFFWLVWFALLLLSPLFAVLITIRVKQWQPKRSNSMTMALFGVFLGYKAAAILASSQRPEYKEDYMQFPVAEVVRNVFIGGIYSNTDKDLYYTIESFLQGIFSFSLIFTLLVLGVIWNRQSRAISSFQVIEKEITEAEVRATGALHTDSSTIYSAKSNSEVVLASNRTTHAVRAFVLFLFYQLTALTLAGGIYFLARVIGNQSEECEALLRQYGACEPQPFLVTLAFLVWFIGIVYSSRIGWREIKKSEI